MISDFEEGEYRGPLFNQLERDTNLLWEPGQVFEEKIGIDRASYCLHAYLWSLHGYNSPLNGSSLRYKQFGYIWGSQKPNKILPDFSLNLFIQAKRSSYSSRSNKKLKPHIKGAYWYFDITRHQQLALEQLEIELENDALVIYASPVFHNQQDLYNNTSNQTIVSNSTFPKVSTLTGHSKWYYDKPGTSGVANPDFQFHEGRQLLESLGDMRRNKGEFNQIGSVENIQKISKSILNIVNTNSDDFLSTRFAYLNGTIDGFLRAWDSFEVKGLREMMQIETFTYLWKLKWYTY